MDFGIALAPGVDAWRWVRRAEELGFSHAWLYDTQLLCADVFVAAALAAARTERIRLGPGVLVPSNRIAPVAANALASLNALAPGRIVLGIGTGFTARATMGLKPVRLAELRDYVRTVRGMLAGETVPWRHAGRTHLVRFLNPEAGLVNLRDPIPVHLSAFGPKARALAAQVADGWMTFLTLLPVALAELDAMRAACEASGRASETVYKTAFTLGCVLREGEDCASPRVRAQAGPLIAVLFHGLVEGRFDATLLPPDLAQAVEAYRRLYESFEPAEARYLQLHRYHLIKVRPEEEPFVTPELVRMATFTGTRDELCDRVRSLAAAGYDQLAIQLVPGQETAIEDWAELFARV